MCLSLFSCINFKSDEYDCNANTLREGGGSADAGLSLLSAAAGMVFAPRPEASFHAAGQWSRAKLDAAAFPDGRKLPKVTAAATTATTGDAGDGGGVLSRV